MTNRKKITPPKLLPEIVLFHILPKLPPKSLFRFKCVCKQWQSFLTTPLFANIHLHHLTTIDRHKKVLYFQDMPCDFRTIDCEAGTRSKPRGYPFAGRASVIASIVNGLACVGIRKNTSCKNNTDEFCDVILWNPLTDEYKTLSRPIDTKCYNPNAMAFELYYTCSDDDYKILSITTDRNVYIYSLRFDSWRKLESTLDYQDRIPFAGDHNLLDEKLHFLRPIEIYKKYMIIRLDLKTEKFTKIVIPSTCGKLEGKLHLTIVRGCIELTIYKAEPPRGTVEMWQMNINGNWMKMVNISHPDPHDLMGYGNLLVVTIKGFCKIDIEKNTKCDMITNPPYLMLPRMYIETFVSPNQFTINEGKN